jgi:hypothetical protein
MTERQYSEVIAELEAAKQEEAEAEGAIKELHKQMRDEFGVKTQEELQVLLKKKRLKLKNEEIVADAEYQRLIRERNKRRG